MLAVAEDGVRVACAPGATASLVASVRNQSGIVDNYDLRVEGLPDGILKAVQVIDEVGRDAVRYFFLMRTMETELLFDIDEATTMSNPSSRG